MRTTTPRSSPPIPSSLAARATRTALLLFLAVSLGLAAPPLAEAHPYHVSLAEVEYNAARNRLEVALRVHSLDLERALGNERGEPIDLDRAPELDRLLAAYLSKSFVVRSDAGDRALPLKWVGKEISLKDAWLYFEVPLPEAARKITLSNRVFFELQPDQANTLSVRVGEVLHSLRLTRGEPQAELPLP